MGDGVAQLGGFGVQRGEREVAERGGEAGGGDGGCGCGHGRSAWGALEQISGGVVVEALVIYEAVWRVGVGLVFEMGGGDGRREYTERCCFLGREA